jgi:predicted phosphoribosyltransferase
MSAYRRLESKADRVICPDISRLPIFAVADAYENWYDVGEEEVCEILEGFGG